MLLHHFCFILIILSFFPDGQTDSLEETSEYVEAFDNEIDSGLKTKKGEQSGDGGAEGKPKVKVKNNVNFYSSIDKRLQAPSQ